MDIQTKNNSHPLTLFDKHVFETFIKPGEVVEIRIPHAEGTPFTDYPTYQSIRKIKRSSRILSKDLHKNLNGWKAEIFLRR
jgi:hypothetical protein